METEAVEIDLIRRAVGRSLDNSFAELADESKAGLDRWERLFGIPFKAGRADVDRLREISARLSNGLPYTYNSLNVKLTELYGEQGLPRHAFEIDFENYTISFYFDAMLEDSFLEIQKLLRSWIPANMVVEVIIVYKRHRKLRESTHRQLGTQTHKQIRKEGLGGNYI
jgi:hypothetical protein